MASIFSASASRRSSRIRSLTSLASTSAARRPSNVIRPAVTSTSISEPSFLRWRQIFGAVEPGPPRALTSWSIDGMSSGGRMSVIRIFKNSARE